MITQQTNYRLQVAMDTFDGETAIANYTTFKVAGPHLKYTLTVSGYTSGATPGKLIATKSKMCFSYIYSNKATQVTC